MFYPLLQFSFFRSFFFREVRVNDDIGETDRILFSEVPSWRNRLPGYVQHFCWTRIEAKRNAFSIHPSFGILLAGWRFFIFIWEVRIRYWSRNLSQEFHRDVLLKRKPNRCIVAFDEAKSKSIVAFWWSEIPIDVLVSSHFDEAKFKLIVVLWLSEIQIDISSNLAN